MDPEGRTRTQIYGDPKDLFLLLFPLCILTYLFPRYKIITRSIRARDCGADCRPRVIFSRSINARLGEEFQNEIPESPHEISLTRKVSATILFILALLQKISQAQGNAQGVNPKSVVRY